MPITEPPEKATFNALTMLVRAAFAVRTLALVATFIPIKPDSPEAKAPHIKLNPTNHEEFSSTSPPYPRSKATITPKNIKTRYSRLRNAIAPS